MNAEGIEILHVTNGDAVIETVAYHLILDFLPAFKALLDKNLRREGKGFFSLCEQLLLVIAETRAKTSKGIGRAEYHRKAQFMSRTLHLLDRRASFTFNGLYVNLVKAFHE